MTPPYASLGRSTSHVSKDCNAGDCFIHENNFSEVVRPLDQNDMVAGTGFVRHAFPFVFDLPGQSPGLFGDVDLAHASLTVISEKRLPNRT